MRNLVEVVQKWGFTKENWREFFLQQEDYDKMHHCAHYYGFCTLTLFSAFDRHEGEKFRLAPGFFSWEHVQEHLRQKDR